MNRSIVIGRLFGIDLRVHPWLLWLAGGLVLYRAMTVGPLAALATTGFLLCLSTIVVLHELGHSLVAQRFGVRVLDITLWPLGGMARMSEIPPSSRAEGLIAVAGPAVNFALAALAAPLLLLAVAAGGLGTLPAAEVASNLLLYFIGINLALGIFNLLPAFPMDGGRILRAWLARRGDWLGATERAVFVGKLFALALVASAFVLGWPAVLIGGFVIWAGSQELWAMRMRYGRFPFAFRGANGAPAGPPRSLFGDLFANASGSTTPPGAPAARPEPPPGPAAAPPRPGEPRRPSITTLGNGQRGFSEADVEALERFPGRLRQPPE